MPINQHLELWKMVHVPMKEMDMVSLERVYYDDKVRVNSDLIQLPELETATYLCEKYDIALKDVYLVQGSTSPYIYYDGEFILISLHHFNEQMMEFIQFPKRREALNKMVEQKNYVEMFALTDNKYAPFILSRIKHLLTSDEYALVFPIVFQMQEYAFADYTEEDLMIVKNNPETIEEKIVSLASRVDKKGCLIIYRGESSASTPYQNAYSWTLNKQMAHFFATRHQANYGKIYQARVSLDDVICYIDREDEVLVSAKDLHDVHETFNYIPRNWESNKARVVEKYENILSKYSNDHADHERSHVENVLYLAHELCFLMSIIDTERDVLLKAISYHDLGRTNNGEDDTHGERSYKCYLQNGEKANEYIEYIMTNHCINDKQAIVNVKKYDVEEKKALRLLKLIKDADSLDRTRIGDLNLNYLRFEKSFKLIKLAYMLNGLS